MSSLYELVESNKYPDHWHVERVNSDGSVDVCVFTGPEAKARADQYAHIMNQGVPARLGNLGLYSAEVHTANQKWWYDLHSGEKLNRNVGELLMLCVSELSEAMEGHRKNLPDDKLPHRSMFEVELVDTLIRIFDIAGGMGLDLEGAYQEKMKYNASREDHTREARLRHNGKKY